ncbi:3-hydroxylacyl-ACP dehydratase [Acidithiobacillus ferrooxidans]|uniref:3-hydroxylacyl-ACP dehydratase n=1 Tax=Acidithiobacillus ferrooxidans TaxID=920 RepID=UPI001D01442D|nr:3-hydroxylacyl-ACP dehydratase [Acidithiobacillus ferrooxidans]
MHLLDAVERWDENTITCTATSHRWEALPLRAHGRLGAACGVEYAAQAMAVHGALLCPATERGDAAKVGYLISVRDVVLRVSRLDDIDGDLTITAEKLAGQRNLLYRFAVLSQACVLLDGRAALLLDADPSAAGHSLAAPLAGIREEPHA